MTFDYIQIIVSNIVLKNPIGKLGLHGIKTITYYGKINKEFFSYNAPVIGQ